MFITCGNWKCKLGSYFLPPNHNPFEEMLRKKTTDIKIHKDMTPRSQPKTMTIF